MLRCEPTSEHVTFFFVSLQGRSAFIGIGFGDRCDAFDFNVALQDHFKYELQRLVTVSQ